MEPSHSLIHWSNLRQTIPYQLLLTENPPTLTNTCSGIVIIIWLPGTVSLVPSSTGKIVCTGLELLNKEIPHLREALSRCKYPKWAMDKVESKFITSNWVEVNTQQDNRSQRENNGNDNTTEGTPKDKPSIGHIVIPYT